MRVAGRLPPPCGAGKAGPDPPPLPDTTTPFQGAETSVRTIGSQTRVISSKRLLFINKDVKIIRIMKGCGAGRLGPAAHLPLPSGYPRLAGSVGFVRPPPPFGNPGEGSRLFSAAQGNISFCRDKSGTWLF